MRAVATRISVVSFCAAVMCVFVLAATAASAEPPSPAFLAKWRKADKLYFVHRYSDAWRTIRPLVSTSGSLDTSPNAWFRYSLAQIACFSGRGSYSRNVANKALQWLYALPSGEYDDVSDPNWQGKIESLAGKSESGDPPYSYPLAEKSPGYWRLSGGGWPWSIAPFGSVSGGHCPGDRGVVAVTIDTGKTHAGGTVRLQTLGFRGGERITAKWWKGSPTDAIATFPVSVRGHSTRIAVPSRGHANALDIYRGNVLLSRRLVVIR